MAAVTKHRKLRGLEQHKCRVSQFRRLESKIKLSPGVSRATVSVLALGDNPFLPLLTSGVCRQSLTILGFEMHHSGHMTMFSRCVFTSFSLCVSPCVQISPFKRTQIRLGGSASKESACNAGDTGDAGSIPGSGRSPRGRNGHPLQYSYLEKSHGQRRLADYSPQGHKDSDMTELLSTHAIILDYGSAQ